MNQKISTLSKETTQNEMKKNSKQKLEKKGEKIT